MIWHFLLVSIQVFLYILYYVLYRCLSNNFEKRFHLVFPEVRNFFKILVTCKKWSVGCFTFVRYPLFLYNHHYHYTRRQYRPELKNILASDYLVWGENLIFVFLSISARPTSLNLNFSLNARLTHQQSGLKSTS